MTTSDRPTSMRFLDVELELGPGALVPRQETELLGRTSIDVLRRAGDAPTFIDMCCGCGNLVCAIASALPGARAFASDLTDPCVELARRNVERLGLGSRVQVLQGDLFAPLDGRGLEGACDAVVCNPPYISTGKLEKESAHLLESEPREAFDGGPYGLSIHQRAIKEALPFLRAGGTLLFEIGAGQERQLKLLFARVKAYEEPELLLDAAGGPRVVMARKKS
jgi:release factor glutamine methyltransferase